MNSFLSWVGGKMSMRELIVDRFPLSYAKYVEVFGGAGWVLFHKQPSKFEVYNDFDSRLVNLFRCVREYPEDLIAELNNFPLNSREEFYATRQRDKDGVGTNIQRAADLYCLVKYSYGNKLRTYSAQPCDITNFFPTIRRAHHRLKSVVIENRDFEVLIKQYDSLDTLFYLDPPYYGTENFYDAGFTRDDHIRLFETLKNIQGKFLLSYNSCDEIKALYADYNIEELTRVNNLSLAFGAGATYQELLISNYDTKQGLEQNKQLTIFD